MNTPTNHFSSQLILNGSMSLLMHLQHAQFSDETVSVDAIAAILCEMLNRLNDEYPGITTDYGWSKAPQRSASHAL